MVRSPCLNWWPNRGRNSADECYGYPSTPQTVSLCGLVSHWATRRSADGHDLASDGDPAIAAL